MANLVRNQELKNESPGQTFFVIVFVVVASICLIWSVASLMTRRKVTPSLAEIRRRLSATQYIQVTSVTDYGDAYVCFSSRAGKMSEGLDALSNSVRIGTNGEYPGFPTDAVELKCFSSADRSTLLITLVFNPQLTVVGKPHGPRTLVRVDELWVEVVHSPEADMYWLFHDETPEEVRNSRQEAWELRRRMHTGK